jgi:SAM-dependent methyltransferase
MTRLGRFLMHVPRFGRLVLEREVFAARCERLQRELDGSLERERTLRQELETSAEEARAHYERLQRELDGSLERESALRQELETSAEEARGHCERLQRELDGNLEREGTLRRELETSAEEARGHCERLQRELDGNLERESTLRRELETATEEARALTAVARGDSSHQRMRDDWDRRALSAPRYFIASGEQAGTEESFFQSGESNIREHIQSDLENICQGRDPGSMRIVEIGCGAGRLTRALAAIFGEVHAIDVSPEMIRLAGEKVGALPNVRLYVNNGADLSALPSSSFHFAFSFLVFQHIPDQSIVESYVREVHRVLVPGALFKFQVNGGDVSGRGPAGTWFGVSFGEPQLRALALRCGFEARYLEGGETQYLWAWFFKP